MSDLVEEFNIEKVESLDYEKLSNQLQYIFKEEQDIVNFINFLKNINKFVNLSADKRHMTQIELGYFRMQISLFEKKIKDLIDKKKNEQLKLAIQKAKNSGEKINEITIEYYKTSTDILDGLIDIHNLVTAWSSYMNDLYFVCGQTSKNLGGII
jgi:hypothetical protein